jgi:hypothetical protein
MIPEMGGEWRENIGILLARKSAVASPSTFWEALYYCDMGSQ